MIRTFVALVVAALAAGTASADSYKLTGDNTTVTFVGSKTDGKHTGGFKKLEGTAEVADGALKGLEVTIQCDSIHSDNDKLTGHLKSPDFFNVKEHATAVVKVTKVEKTAKGYTLSGDLTMCGKTGPFEMPATVEVKDGVLTIASDFKIDRTKWGMTYGKGKVNDEVELKVAVTAKK